MRPRYSSKSKATGYRKSERPLLYQHCRRGTLTELTYEVPSKLKTMIGQLAYYFKGMEKMVSLAPQELIIKASGQEVIHDEFMLFLIANTNSVGGFEKLAPGATIDDGLLDVIAVRKCNLAEMIRLVTLALRGEHLQDKKIVYFKTDYMEVTSPGYVQLNLDGELGALCQRPSGIYLII